MFNVHIQSKLLYRKPVMGTGTGLRRFLCPGPEKKKGGRSKGGPPALAGTRDYKQSDRNRQQASQCSSFFFIPYSYTFRQNVFFLAKSKPT